MKWSIVALCGLMVVGCSKQEEPIPEMGKPTVAAVNYPLAYFAERIAGDQVSVVFPEMDGDPAFWKPAPEDVVKFQEADLILLNGASYAKWVPTVSLPQRKMLNTSVGLEDQFIALDGTVTHTHGPGAAHAHGDLAFTIWLDPEMAIHQAASIQRFLAEKWDIATAGLVSLEADLKELDESLVAAFKKVGNQPLLGSHPVYQYLARRYDLNMRSVHWEPDAVPDQAMWRELNDILEAHEATVMLWEDAPLPEVIEMLNEKGIKSIVFNPCGNRPASGDYLSVLLQNLKALESL